MRAGGDLSRCWVSPILIQVTPLGSELDGASQSSQTKRGPELRSHIKFGLGLLLFFGVCVFSIPHPGLPFLIIYETKKMCLSPFAYLAFSYVEERRPRM